MKYKKLLKLGLVSASFGSIFSAIACGNNNKENSETNNSQKKENEDSKNETLFKNGFIKTEDFVKIMDENKTNNNLLFFKRTGSNNVELVNFSKFIQWAKEPANNNPKNKDKEQTLPWDQGGKQQWTKNYPNGLKVVLFNINLQENKTISEAIEEWYSIHKNQENVSSKSRNENDPLKTTIFVVDEKYIIDEIE